MARLPIVDDDDGTWGTILNEFLEVEHNADGTQKTLGVTKGGTNATNAATARTNLGAISSSDAQALVDTHVNDTTDAHDASAISILDTAADFTATDVEGALAELQTADEADEAALAAHISDASAAHAASAISVSSTTLVGIGTDVQAVFEEIDNDLATDIAALASHLADTADAHDASAISILDTAADFTATDVEGALAELQTRNSEIAWGRLGQAARTTDVTAIGMNSTITGLSVTVTLVTGRLYRVECTLYGGNQNGAGYVEISIKSGSTIIMKSVVSRVAGGSTGAIQMFADVTGSGSTTFTVAPQGSATSWDTWCGATYPGKIVVDDIGSP